jgi:hypothetical protein
MRCVGQRLVADVTILDLAGQRGLWAIDTEVTEKIRALIGERQMRFLLNLQGVSYVNPVAYEIQAFVPGDLSGLTGTSGGVTVRPSAAAVLRERC